MENREYLKGLQEFAQKPMAGFEVQELDKDILIRTKPKNGLFGCLGVFILLAALAVFFFMSDESLKYFIPILIIFAGASMLYKLSINTAQILVKKQQGQIIYSNSNFIGKLGRKPTTVPMSELLGFSMQEELRSGMQSASGTSSQNIVLRVYLVAKEYQLPLITVNKGLFTTEEMEEVARLIQKIVKPN